MSLTKLESMWATDEASIRAAQDEIDLAYEMDLAYEHFVNEIESQPEGEETYLADSYDSPDNFDGRT